MANTTNTGITLSTTDSLSTGQRIMIGAAMRAMEPAAPDPDLVASVTLPDGHKQFDLLTYARLAQATSLQEGVDLSVTQQLFANTISLNPTEHGVIVTLSKRAIRRQPESLQEMAGTQMGVSLRERETRDVYALYDGFSEVAGAAGTTLDITYFRGSVAYLMTDNDSEFGPAPMPVRASLHAEHISDLVADLTNGNAGNNSGTAVVDGINASPLSAEMVQRWWRGADRAYGVQVFHTGYLSRDSGDDAKGGLFAQEALFMAMEGNDEPTEEADNSARIVEYGLFKSWAETERADPHGVEMYFDAAKTI